jgi:hypothetical protein
LTTTRERSPDGGEFNYQLYVGVERIMSTELQHVSTKSKDNPAKGLSPTKLSVIGAVGTIVAAVITAVASVLTGFWDNAGIEVQESPLGSVGEVTSNESGSEVAVTGWAASDVDDVVVLIGPKSSDGQYWVANASVSDQRWGVVVQTDPRVAPGYKVKAYFNRGIMPAVSAKPLEFIPPTPPPTPPAYPTDITQCAMLYGDRCFTGPQWGPPAIYQPNG